MNVREAYIKGIMARGVQPGVNLDFLKPYVNVDTIPIDDTGWNTKQVKVFQTRFNEWSKITLKGQKVSVMDMDFNQLQEPELYKQNIKELQSHKWTYKGSVNSVDDQLYDKIGKQRTWKLSRLKIKGLGTETGQVTKNFPPDLYKNVRYIEELYPKGSLDRMTAHFMSLTGHRGPETSRLTIEMFHKTVPTESGSSYGTNYNLHAKGWSIKTGTNVLGHFDPLAKIVIFNALETHRLNNVTSGPLFPNAAAIDKAFTKELVEIYGEKSISGFVRGKGETITNPSRQMLRNLDKARNSNVTTVKGFGDTHSQAGIEILEGGDVKSTNIKVRETYSDISTREAAVNRVGVVNNAQYLAYGNRLSAAHWVSNNGYKIPPGFLRPEIYGNLVPIKINPQHIELGRANMTWIPAEDFKVYQGDKIFPKGHSTAVIDPDEVNAQKFESKFKTEQKRFETYEKTRDFRKYSIDRLIKDEGLSRAKAEQVYDEVTTGKRTKPLKIDRTSGSRMDKLFDKLHRTVGKTAKAIPFISLLEPLRYQRKGEERAQEQLAQYAMFASEVPEGYYEDERAEELIKKAQFEEMYSAYGIMPEKTVEEGVAEMKYEAGSFLSAEEEELLEGMGVKGPTI